MSLPKALVAQWVREAVGEDVAIHKETLDWVGECAEEFLLRVGAAANAIAEEAATKENYRISADDVIAALETYVGEIKARQSKLEQEVQKKKKRIASRKAATKSSGETHEQLLAEQNALFQQASRKAVSEGW